MKAAQYHNAINCPLTPSTRLLCHGLAASPRSLDTSRAPPTRTPAHLEQLDQSHCPPARPSASANAPYHTHTWNSLTNSPIFSSGGRMVVRRWKVPSSWPKPEPGTVTMPVASSSCGARDGGGNEQALSVELARW